MTVTLIISEYSVHSLDPSVDLTALLNQVSAESAGDVYVGSVARLISVKKIPSGLSCH